MGPMKTLFILFTVSAMLMACGDAGDAPAVSTPASTEQKSDAANALTETAADRLTLPATPPPARLPAGIAPTHYTLHLDIDPRKERFTGSARIDIELAGA